MSHKLKINSGTRITRIQYQIGETQFVREIAEHIDSDLYVDPISKNDFEVIFDFDPYQRELELDGDKLVFVDPSNKKEVN